MLSAMARSYLPPDFGKSAGARLTVMQAGVYNGTPDPFLAFFDGSFGKTNNRKCGQAIR